MSLTAAPQRLLLRSSPSSGVHLCYPTTSAPANCSRLLGRGTSRAATSRLAPCRVAQPSSIPPQGVEPEAWDAKLYIQHVRDAAADRVALGLVAGSRALCECACGAAGGLSAGAGAGTTMQLAQLEEAMTLQEAMRTITVLQRRNADLRQQLSSTKQQLTAAAESSGHPGASSSSSASSGGASARSQAVRQAEQWDDEELNATCVLQHPGALCCTTTSLSLDEVARQCRVTMTTTLRCANDTEVAAAFSPSDLRGLAAQALLTSAGELCRATTHQVQEAALQSSGGRDAHKAVRALLSHGRIAEVRRVIPSAFGHESYEVAVEDPGNGRRIGALFKPRVLGDSDGWHRAPIEWVAYQLNCMLGMDYVPPVAYRTGGLELPGHGCFEEGALLFFCDDAVQLRFVPHEAWGVPRDVLLSDTRVLDVLLHNSDRHHGHFLFGRHWADGVLENGQWRGALRPVMIDHAAGFREGAYVSMQHENAFQTGAVRCVSASTYLRLRFLDASAITAAFSGHLTEREMRGMLHRRNHILRYLDRLVEVQGYAATVVASGAPWPNPAAESPRARPGASAAAGNGAAAMANGAAVVANGVAHAQGLVNGGGRAPNGSSGDGYGALHLTVL